MIPHSKTIAENWMASYRRRAALDRLHPCEHGHFDCSTVEHGPCMDEILSQWPELEDEHAIANAFAPADIPDDSCFLNPN